MSATLLQVSLQDCHHTTYNGNRVIYWRYFIKSINFLGRLYGSSSWTRDAGILSVLGNVTVGLIVMAEESTD